MLLALTDCDEVGDTGKYPFFTDAEVSQMLEEKYNQEVTSIRVYEEDVVSKSWGLHWKDIQEKNIMHLIAEI